MSMDARITIGDVEMAFNMLLGRSAGQEGLDHFQKHGVDAGWTRRTLREMIKASPEYWGQTERLISLHGFKVFVDPNDPDMGVGIIMHNGGYEEHNLLLISKMLQKGDTFVDVGANIGLLSLMARMAVGDSGRVVCFEPLAANAALLIKSIIYNDFKNMVVYPVALSDAVRTLYLDGISNGMLKPEGWPERKLTTMPGDSYLETESRIDFLKMDIEGHEPFALRGISRALKKHKPLVLCEYNPVTLKDNSTSGPTEFVDQIFRMTDEVQVIDYDGDVEVVRNTRSLLDLWIVKNRHFTGRGRIADGMLHFDLLFRAEPH